MVNSFFALAMSTTAQMGAVDIDFVAYKFGAVFPAGSGGLPPQISNVSPVPATQGNLFYPATNGISFAASSSGSNIIPPSGVVLILNGINVSSDLKITGPNTNLTVTYGGLVDNRIYNGQITVTDSGGQSATFPLLFDTFSEARAVVIEAEDYNYSNGVYQLDPIPVSGLDTNGSLVNGNGIGYFGLFGTPDVDFSKPGGSYHSEYSEYRGDGDAILNRVQVTQGSYSTASRDEAADIVDTLSYVPPLRIHDTQRSQYVATNVWEYQIRLMSVGDWFNYTRVFQPANYFVYLRCGTFGSSTLYLDRVSSDPTTTNQTTVRLGTFSPDNHLMQLNYKYEPLMFASSAAVLNLSGTNTLRLTMAGTVSKDDRLVVMDYLLFVPIPEPRLSISLSGSTVNLTWPLIPFRLQTSPSVSSPVWTDVTSGIVTYLAHYGYSGPALDAGFYRLIYP